MNAGDVRGGGDGEPRLLLIHGLGASGAVWETWRPLLAEQWPGSWLAPDLPGHGSAAPLSRYSFGGLAAALAERLPPGGPLVILGHSLGGVLGLALASGWYGVPVAAVIGLGIKVAWTDDELTKARGLAAQPVRYFAGRDEAADRYLRVSGLTGLLDPGDPAVGDGIRQEPDGWRLALDPAAFGVGAPDLPGLLAAARAQVVLARGEHDRMVSHEQLTALQPAAVDLPGLGHNAHVEDPAAVLRLLMPYRQR